MKNFFLSTFLLSVCCAAVSQGLWIQKQNSPATTNKTPCFTINSKGYFFSGAASSNFFEYDPVTNVWTAKADCPIGYRQYATGFATDSFGFVGGGSTSGMLAENTNNFYKYDPVANAWSAIASYPDSISGGIGFSVNNTGYVAGGFNVAAVVERQCYSYNSSLNQWVQVDSMPSAMAFSFAEVVNSKVYCGFGQKGLSLNTDSVYEYDPVADSWTSKAALHVISSFYYNPIRSFVVNNKIYTADPRVNGGTHGGMNVYDPGTNSWSTINTFPYRSVSNCESLTPAFSFSLGGKGYLGVSSSCENKKFWEFDPSLHFDITSATPDTLCEFQDISVAVSTNILFNSGNSFKLKLKGYTQYGNNSTTDSVAATTSGTYTFKVPKTVFTGNSSLEELSVESNSPVYETGFYPLKTYLERAPNPTNFADNFNYCGGSAVLLYRTNDNAVSYTWTSSPAGVTGSSYMLSYTPTQNISIYSYEIVNSTGCEQFDTINIIYNTPPSTGITDSSFMICPGSNLTIGGGTVTNASYVWSGSGLNSTNVNPVVAPSVNSNYQVLVTDTVSGCTAQTSTSVTMAEPTDQPICFVTVDSASSHNVIVWEKVDKEATDSFYVYREITTNNYQQIGAVHRDSLSEYHDYTANPNITAFRYKIGVKDTCGNSGNLSNYHNTIHLQYLGGGNLLWNVYLIENEITPVASFDVSVDTAGNGNWQLLVNLPGNQHTATDINFNQHPNALYRVVANWSVSCTAARSVYYAVLSNIIGIDGTGLNDTYLNREVSLYPNPTSGEVRIYAGNLKIERVRVLSVDGKLITDVPHAQKGFVNLAALASGVYMIEVTTNEGVVVKRCLKNE